MQRCKNININSCKNCIHFKHDYSSDLSKCKIFGTKNIIDDKINYDYVNNCRNNESKCGIEGKYFEKDIFSEVKIIKYEIIENPFKPLSFVYLIYMIYLINNK